MNNKNKGLMLSILGILGLIIITAGVTYAFFNYAKQGTTENSVTTGTITFLYTEVSGVGRGISIDDAFPISDSQGTAQIGEGKVFDFKVTSDTPSNASIPYEVTARKKENSTLDEAVVKLYLTKVTGDIEEEVLLDNYSNLTQTTKVEASKYIEKTIFQGKVPANSSNYEQAFRLRMWIDDEIDFSPVQDEEGNDTYPYNDKTFTIIVNVYANAKVVTDEEIANESKAEISSLVVNGEELTTVENQDYDYETSLPEGTTSTTINIETISEYASVNVERIDSLAYSNNSSIKRLSTAKILELNPGDNYFKITVISENKEVENEYKIKITVKQGEILLSDAIFNRYTTIYENPTLTTTSQEANENGLYKSTNTNDGSPTYYFRGNIENNYVDFAGFTWRIVRINEDGTIRLIMQDITDNTGNINTYIFNSGYTSTGSLYYNNSGVKPLLEEWYENKITINEIYSSRVATGDYYCEQAKVTADSGHLFYDFLTVYTSYVPTFKCENDENGYGILNSNIGLMTYDEMVYAGEYYNNVNTNTYLYNKKYFWTMTTAGYHPVDCIRVWYVGADGKFGAACSYDSNPRLRPVINLKANVTVTGTGASDDHWIIQ